MLWNIKHTDDYRIAKEPTFDRDGYLVGTTVRFSKALLRERGERWDEKLQKYVSVEVKNA